MQEEIWKPITGYEDLYEVSNLGRIKRLERRQWMNNPKTPYYRTLPEKILSTKLGIKKTKNRYKKHDNLYITQSARLYSDNWSFKNFSIAQLVASEFLPNPNNFPYVRKKDGNISNCNVDNLEWSNKKEIYSKLYNELEYEVPEETKKEMSKIQKKIKNGWTMPRKIRCIELNKIYNSLTEAAADFGLCSNAFSASCRDKSKQKTGAGYHWEYVD